MAFKLSDTYGFQLDLTQDILRGRGLDVDVAGFEAALDVQRGASRAAGFTSGYRATEEIWFEARARTGATRFAGYGATSGDGRLVAIAAGGLLAQEM